MARKRRRAKGLKVDHDARVGSEMEIRHQEHVKYERAYGRTRYRMKKARRRDAVGDLKALECLGSYLDVACGRGDMLAEARRLGFTRVWGTEIVSALLNDNVLYGEVHDLPFPDKSFDVVTLFDVIEHLIPGDDEKACKEMVRVGRRHVLLTANNRPSFNKQGDDLHINIRTYDEWDRCFQQWFAPHRVTWIKGKRNYVSEAWRVDLV